MNPGDPLYLITLRDRWATFKEGRACAGSVPAFVTPGAADKFRRRVAKAAGGDVRDYRVVEYRVSGEVREG